MPAGIFGLKCDGTYKIGYNNYSADPTGMGQGIVDFIKRIGAEGGWDQLKANCANLQLVDYFSKATPEEQRKYKDLFHDEEIFKFQQGEEEPLTCGELTIDQLNGLCDEKNKMMWEEWRRTPFRKRSKLELPTNIEYSGKPKPELMKLCCGKKDEVSPLTNTIPPALWMWKVLFNKLEDNYKSTIEGIYDGTLEHLPDSIAEASDSSNTEFGYVINLDDMTLDVFEGRQHKPQKGNPFGTKVARKVFETKYYPIRLVEKFPVTNIPSNWEVLAYPYGYSDTEQVESLKCKGKALLSNRVSCNGTRMKRAIPPDCTVTSLDLGGCGITKIPRQLQFLEFMETLGLNDNQIKEIQIFDHRFGELPSLRTLDLQNNQIKQVQGISTLKNLRSINLKGNQIQEIAGIDKLPELTRASFQNNPLTNEACAEGKAKHPFINITCGGGQ